MSPWSVFQVIEPALPPTCDPQNDFLYSLSATFHTCVPTNLAFISTLLGSLSIVSWLFAQLPQIHKNYTLGSTSGLSFFFLAEWLLGDLSNLLGSILTEQALWQVIIASYYCLVDMALVSQWVWYEHLRHGKPLISVWRRGRSPDDGSSGGETSDIIDGISILSEAATVNSQAAGKPEGESPAKPITRSNPMDVFRMPRFSSSPSSVRFSEDDITRVNTPASRTIQRVAGSSSPMPSPKTVLYISLLLAVVARASPLQPPSDGIVSASAPGSTTHEPLSLVIGRLLSWMSTLLYLGSRLPQLYKNHKRKSTSGLSPTLFAAAFCGNLFYSTSLLTNPCAWASFPPSDSHGWVGEGGSDRAEWVGRATPFFLGAAGVLAMDAMVGFQFWWFGSTEGEKNEEVVVVVAVERVKGKRWRWRRVSGWMRGWMPTLGQTGLTRGGLEAGHRSGEQEGLLSTHGAASGYGGV